MFVAGVFSKSKEKRFVRLKGNRLFIFEDEECVRRLFRSFRVSSCSPEISIIVNLFTNFLAVYGLREGC